MIKPTIRWLTGPLRDFKSQGRDWLGVFIPAGSERASLHLHLHDQPLQYFSSVTLFDDDEHAPGLDGRARSHGDLLDASGFG